MVVLNKFSVALVAAMAAVGQATHEGLHARRILARSSTPGAAEPSTSTVLVIPTAAEPAPTAASSSAVSAPAEESSAVQSSSAPSVASSAIPSVASSVVPSVAASSVVSIPGVSSSVPAGTISPIASSSKPVVTRTPISSRPTGRPTKSSSGVLSSTVSAPAGTDVPGVSSETITYTVTSGTSTSVITTTIFKTATEEHTVTAVCALSDILCFVLMN